MWLFFLPILSGLEEYEREKSARKGETLRKREDNGEKFSEKARLVGKLFRKQV